MSIEAVQKLNIQTETHLKPYKLAWLKKGGEAIVSKHALVAFSVGVKYKDTVWCDIIAMDAFHLLLGRPWQYDREVSYNGRTNTYSFMFDDVKIVLLPYRQMLEKAKPAEAEKATSLLSLAQFDEVLKETEVGYRLMGKEVAECSSIPKEVVPLITEFSDVFPEELLDGLPPMHDIQYYIDLEPGAALPNRPHYRMSPHKHEELRQ